MLTIRGSSGRGRLVTTQPEPTFSPKQPPATGTLIKNKTLADFTGLDLNEMFEQLLTGEQNMPLG